MKVVVEQRNDCERRNDHLKDKTNKQTTVHLNRNSLFLRCVNVHNETRT